MVAEILMVLVAATLLVLIVAMVRQRDGAAQGSPHNAGSTTDPWSGTARVAPSRPATAEVVPPPREPDAAGHQVIEHLRRLEQRAAPGLAAQIMPVFLRDTATRLESLRDAVRQRDGVAAHRVAHTLHGSAATVGAATMVHACAEIIREVRLGAFDGCDRLIGELDQDFESIRRAAESMRI